jgi:hypothetical protein
MTRSGDALAGGRVQRVQSGIRIPGGGNVDGDHESTIFQLILHGKSARFRNSISFKAGLSQVPGAAPNSVERRAMVITCPLKIEKDRLFAFKGDTFLGEIATANAYIASSEDSAATISVFPAISHSDPPWFLSISIYLTVDDFSGLFRPLMLGSPWGSLDLALGAPGFQNGPEASFSEIDDVQHFVIETDRILPLEVRSIIWNVERP